MPKRFIHPVAETIALNCKIFTAENQIERLVVFSAAQGSPEAERLALLRGDRGVAGGSRRRAIWLRRQ
jgi:hypothetical protein